MGKKKIILNAQPYPRVDDEQSDDYSLVDDSKLQPHRIKISSTKMKKIIINGIHYAHQKSSRGVIEVPDGLTSNSINAIYKKEGRELFNYFRKYYEDPASSAHQCLGKHYSDVASQQFRNRIIQKGRMNSGWRYQYVAKEAANESRRFLSVSDIGAAEADFNVKISQKDSNMSAVNIYVSMKNRVSTLGGQDWPKAIKALEDIAKNDKNRQGPYLCVFGIAMQRGRRSMKVEQKTKRPYSVNTEVWLSDFFWPFFVNYRYDEIVKLVLEVLIASTKPDELNIVMPQEIVTEFGRNCEKYQLLDSNGCFNDAYKLVDVFCGISK